MKKRVYLETTVVSYLAARRSRDLIVAAKQQITQQWWETRKGDFELYVSQVVADEAGRGDHDAVERRHSILKGIRRLQMTEMVGELARALVRRQAVAAEKIEDALHIALASVHGMDFLLTWNCSHLANAEKIADIESIIESCGYECPRICTPDELLGVLT